MKIYNATFVGKSRLDNKGISFFHFAYKSKFVEGTGVICCSRFDNKPLNENLEINKAYDIYINNKNGFNNLVAVYEHKN